MRRAGRIAACALAGFGAAPGGAVAQEPLEGVPAIEAHRGGPKANGEDYRPENTLAAFASARTLGVRIELDVQLSRDGVPVVFHDRTIGAATATRRCTGRVTAKTAAQLGACEVIRPRNLPGGPAPHNTIPTLSRALGHPSTRGASWSVELKLRTGTVPFLRSYVRRVAAVLQRAPIAHDRLIVSSFSQLVLRLWRAEAVGRWPLSRARRLLLTDAASPARPILEARRAGASWLGADHTEVDDAYVEALRPRRLRLAVWTPNSVAAIERMARDGVHTIITDDPMRAKNVVFAACLRRGHGLTTCRQAT